MKKSLLSLLIITFSFLQLTSFFHNAKYDFKDHTHNSQICQIYIGSKRINDVLLDFHSFDLIIEFETEKPNLQYQKLVSQIYTLFSSARSPPYSLI